MSVMKNIYREKIFNDIKKNHDKYFVTYRPINSTKDEFAILSIIFIQLVDNKEIASIMEEELHIWISKYPLPIMVTSYDNKSDGIYLKDIKESNHLVGYINKENNKVVKTWNIEGLPDGLLYDDNVDIDLIYEGLSYKKRDDIEMGSNETVKEKIRIKKLVDAGVILWLVISVIIAFLGWRSFWVGAAAFIYSLYRAVRRFFKLKGYKTKREKEDQEKTRKMNHYYYHCERNPKGFRRLRAENFEEVEKERIKKERENIKN